MLNIQTLQSITNHVMTESITSDNIEAMEFPGLSLSEACAFTTEQMMLEQVEMERYLTESEAIQIVCAMEHPENIEALQEAAKSYGGLT